jgi:protoporphyrinogen oxidase
VTAIAEPVLPFIRTGFRITSLKKNNSGWLISNGTETITASRVISTIPVQHLIPCLDNVPEDATAACRALVYNSLICVNIGIRGQVPSISWMYIPDTDLGKTNRLSFPSNFSRHTSPEGCSAILAEITHRPGDAMSTISDEKVTGEVIGMLEKMQICARDQVIFSSVERQPFAYVVYDLGYQKNIAVLQDFCRSRGIPLVGRFAQFEYLNMDACIRSVMDFLKGYPRE